MQLDDINPLKFGDKIGAFTKENLPPLYYTAKVASGAVGYGVLGAKYAISKVAYSHTPQQFNAGSSFLSRVTNRINPLSRNTTTSIPDGPTPSKRGRETGMNWGELEGSQSGSDVQKNGFNFR